MSLILYFYFSGSFSGHGGYNNKGCTTCAKFVWVGVLALAIQAFMMMQGGRKRKRKRRNIENKLLFAKGVQAILLGIKRGTYFFYHVIAIHKIAVALKLISTFLFFQIY